MEMTTEIVSVTPQMAEAWLKNNVANRKLRPTIVDTYASDMKSGRWVPSHQGIAFDSKGELVDGQHRLSAIVKSGVIVKMVVTTGVEQNENIDNHIKRTLVDTTGHTAYEVAVARMILNRFRSGGDFVHAASSSEIKEFIEQHKENFEFMNTYMKTQKPGLRVSSVKAAFFTASFYEDSLRLTEFAEVFGTGRYTDYAEDSAALRLRENLMSNVGTGTRPAPKLTYLRTQLAIKNFCERKMVGRLTTPADYIYQSPAQE